jgi:hypothetical protein
LGVVLYREERPGGISLWRAGAIDTHLLLSAAQILYKGSVLVVLTAAALRWWTQA